MNKNKLDVKKYVISKWKKRGRLGGKLQQVVYVYPLEGIKNKKGKTIFRSVTKHETI